MPQGFHWCLCTPDAPTAQLIGRLNHVGVATPSIDDAVAMYRDLFGATVSKAKFALMRRFFETIASRVKHVYVIANRDVLPFGMDAVGAWGCAVV